MLLYEDGCKETSQDPLPTVCIYCGCDECFTSGFKNNPTIMFQCGTTWKPRSAYSKRPEPVWEQYEACFERANPMRDAGSGI